MPILCNTSYNILIHCMFLVLLLLQFSIVSDADEQPITSAVLFKRPKQAPTVLNYGGKLYYFQVVFKGNFFKSMQFCSRHGMKLVSITSQAENDRLGKFAEQIGHSHSEFWTSGTDLHDRHDWIWLSTGQSLEYTNWYPGEPNENPDPESCLVARTVDNHGFTWNNGHCVTELYAICETSTENNCTIL